MKPFYTIMLLVFLLGFVFGAWVFFPAERVCTFEWVEPETFYLVENYSEQDGFYYADLDDFKPVKNLGGGVLVWDK